AGRLEDAPADPANALDELPGPVEALVALLRGEVDLDEVRAGPDGRLREEYRGGRVTVQVRVAALGELAGKCGDVQRSLGDRERDVGGAGKGVADRRVAHVVVDVDVDVSRHP